MSELKRLARETLAVESIESDEDSLVARRIINHLREIILKSDYKHGLRLHPGSILNAYREGDISFYYAKALITMCYNDFPKRIQRKRLKGWKMPEGAVYVGRPTKWGNPWKVSEEITLINSIELYSQYMYQGWELQKMCKEELKGKDLACWCPLDRPCHADVLLLIANL